VAARAEFLISVGSQEQLPAGRLLSTSREGAPLQSVGAHVLKHVDRGMDERRWPADEKARADDGAAPAVAASLRWREDAVPGGNITLVLSTISEIPETFS
jgi:hypothetical protein